MENFVDVLTKPVLDKIAKELDIMKRIVLLENELKEIGSEIKIYVE